jgi:aspartate kinase
MEQPIISGIAFNRDEAKLTVLGVPDKPGIAALILGSIADANIDVDMIVQNVAPITPPTSPLPCIVANSRKRWKC